jgi:hypothetical protein
MCIVPESANARMKLSLDPSLSAPRHVTAEALALAGWYEAQSAVRHLWGIRNSQRLRVIIAIEPAPDNDDVYPLWLANSAAWTRDLRLRVGRQVQLELIHESLSDGIEIDADDVVIAVQFWRDATLTPPNEAL